VRSGRRSDSGLRNQERSLILRLFIAVAFLMAAADAAPAAAPAPAVGASRSISELQAAELLLDAGKLAEAKRVLDDLQARNPRDSEVEFLLGLIAVQEKRYRTAVHLFRDILVREPGAVRVRLELGRAFYLDKDWDNAERQFRLALAGDLPSAARSNVEGYISAIRRERSWSYNFSLAAAPDSNLNAGPAIHTVDIYGLPFELSDQSRRRSGVGLAMEAGGEWSPMLRPGLGLRLGAQAHTALYREGIFDDTTASVYAGPRFVFGKWDVSPLASYFRRRYGGALYDQGGGASVQATYYASGRLTLNSVLTGQYVSYGAPEGQSGPAASATIGAFYALTPRSTIGAQSAVARQWAGIAAYANTAFQMQLGYYRDLRGGISISLQPSWVHITYDAPLAAFGATRIDNQLGVQATLLDRRIDIAGFTPRLLYAYTWNTSTIPLYAYSRNRIEIGVTRLF
jgi:tetratricopeptide (TPR) repeat protein